MLCEANASIWEYSILAGVLVSIFGIVSLWLIKFKLPTDVEMAKREQDREDRLANVQEEFTRNVSAAVNRIDTAIAQIATATEGTQRAAMSMDKTSDMIRKDLEVVTQRLDSMEKRLTGIEERVK